MNSYTTCVDILTLTYWASATCVNISKPRRPKVVFVNRINNYCPCYVIKACYVASWQKRPIQNQNNHQAIAKNLKGKSSCIHVLCDDVLFCFRQAKKYHSSLHWDYILFLSYAMRVKNQFKEHSKASKTTKEATNVNKNDVAHEIYNTLLRGGQIGIFPSYQGELSRKTWFKSTLRLRSRN